MAKLAFLYSMEKESVSQKIHFISGSDEDMIQGDNRYSGYSGEADTR